MPLRASVSSRGGRQHPCRSFLVGLSALVAFCRTTGLKASEIAVVGDSPHDLDMARAAGAGRAIGVLTGVSLREVLSLHADLVLESIADLETALELPV